MPFHHPNNAFPFNLNIIFCRSFFCLLFSATDFWYLFFMQRKCIFRAGLEERANQNVKLSRTPTHYWNKNLVLLLPLATELFAVS